jgi:hypothetical protein
MLYWLKRMLKCAHLSVVGVTLLGALGCGAAVESREPVSAASFDAKASQLRIAAERLIGTRAWAAYRHDQKVGFAVEETAIEQTEQGLCLRVQSENCMKVEMFGTELTRFLKASAWYLLEDEGRLVRLRELEDESGALSLTEGILRDGRFEIRVDRGGQSVVRYAEPPRESVRSKIERLQWISPSTPIGATLSVWTTDLSQADLNRQTTFTLRSKPEGPGARGGIDFYEVEEVTDGLHSITRSRDGVKSDLAKSLGIELRAEPEVQARAMPTTLSDITDMTLYPVDTYLGNHARGLEHVVVVLQGLRHGYLPPETATQSVAELSPGMCRIWINHEAPESAREPIDAATRARFLRSEPGIESDHTRIVAKADEVVGGLKAPLEKAERLEQWVHDKIIGDPAKRSTSALVILEQQAGVCTESARLFVALARAAGVPAREVGGLMYSGSSSGGCYVGHAWAQVHDGTRWVDIDPSWDEVGVDAGHICLQLDSPDDAYENSLETLKIKVERYSRR